MPTFKEIENAKDEDFKIETLPFCLDIKIGLPQIFLKENIMNCCLK
jgi:hypothetical protein